MSCPNFCTNTGEAAREGTESQLLVWEVETCFLELGDHGAFNQSGLQRRGSLTDCG